MSFNFKWPTFSEDFHKSAAQMLDSALNRGQKPKVIADDIRVEELGMGTIPPELEILEIGDLGTDRFRGIFRLTYAGDAHLVLKTKVQANPLTKPTQPDIGLFPSATASRGILFAAAPLIVPMHLRLSSVKLRAIVVLVVSKAKGITLVFKNDPLESVEVSSTFDSVAVIQKYLQQEIEGQLREMFREDLPGIIHRLSQKWLSGQVDNEKQQTKQRNEEQSSPLQSQDTQPSQTQLPSDPAPLIDGAPRSNRGKGRRRQSSSASTADLTKSPSSSPPKPRSGIRRPRVSQSISMPTIPGQTGFSFLTSSSFGSAFPDIENYDPTYGLRPDDLPTHSGFSGLGKLAQRASNGLKDLATAQDDSQPPHLDPDGGLNDTSAYDRSYEYSDADSEDPDDDLDQSDVDCSNSLIDHGDASDEHPMFDQSIDDVSDLEIEKDVGPDTSIDYTRFGYPPASAAFSDTQELNRASSIIFDDDIATSNRRKPLDKAGSELGRASSTRSIRSAFSSPGRRKKTAEVFETIPAVGGGTVTRPRVYHIASKVQAPEMGSDDEHTARPSQYGGTPSTRTGARFGSDYGSATIGARSSRANTSSGYDESPQLESYPTGNDSEDSLIDLPPESLHSSDNSRPQSSHGIADPSRYKTMSTPRQQTGRDTTLSISTSSTAPTSTGFVSSSNSLNTRSTPSVSAASDGSGYRFHKHKSVGQQRTTDRAGFVGSNDRGGIAASPIRSRPALRQSVSSPPRNNDNSWQQGHPAGSPPMARELLSTSPFRNSGGSSAAAAQGSPQASGAMRGVHYAGNSHPKISPASTHLSVDASAHFLDLVNSNHTFSPFTRNLEHFTVRSAPVTPGLQTMSGSASAVGSSGASGTGTGSGGSQPGAPGNRDTTSSQVTPRPLLRSYSQPLAIPQQSPSSHLSPGDGAALASVKSPARRRRTFQLGKAENDAGKHMPRKTPNADTDVFGSSKAHDFERASSSGASATSSSGFKNLRQRVRPNSMGPPSEAARMSSLRYEAIRE